MDFLQSVSFATPWALAGLAALPVIWWLLRFVPPKPQRVDFPPVRILLGLDTPEVTPDKTPWWLLLLRLALAALLVLGVSHPLWSDAKLGQFSNGTMLVVMDDGWPSGRYWQQRQTMLRSTLEEAQSAAIPVVLALTTPVSGKVELVEQSASDAIEKITNLEPRALTPERDSLAAAIDAYQGETVSRVVWLSDGTGASDAAALAALLARKFPDAEKTVLLPPAAELPVALTGVRLSGSDIKANVLTARPATQSAVVVEARAGNGRVVSEQEVRLQAGKAEATFQLPVELRNQIQSIVIRGESNAAARFVLDDRWRRKTVAVLSGSSFELDQPLLSPVHYVTRALEPFANVTEPESADELKLALDAGLSMLVLADIGRLPDDQFDMANKWTENGGVLLRFAGPHMAAGTDALVPVTLREGGRELGSALSWEEPQGLQPFAEGSPLTGVAVDTEVRITRQVLAEPDVDLATKTWLSLNDGTPIMTATRKGKGLVVLFHVTANPDWSNLPLSGMFVETLKRIVDVAPAAGSAQAAASSIEGTNQAFTPKSAMSGRGELVSPEPTAKPIAASMFDKAVAGPDTMPGIYERNSQDRAINLAVTEADIAAIPQTLPGWIAAGYTPPERINIAPYLFAVAFLLFLFDGLASLFIGGAFRRTKSANAAAVALFLTGSLLASHSTSFAQTSDADIQAALQTSLAYVATGDVDVDTTSEQGLQGLSTIVSERTSAILGPIRKLDIALDDLAFYPIIYWPVTAEAAEPSPAVIAKLEQYMKTGGTLFFDLREDGLDTDALSGGQSMQQEALRRILGKLDVPPLAPVEDQHVLTRTFYLLQEFPGRYMGGKLWVEADPAGTRDPGSADGVSAIIIGSNDYAAAWAMDDNFQPLNAIVGGDESQREYAFRTGINVVMYALTGNYKADQVHIPALLERLGQ
jgi:hypothetical protein